MSMGLGHKYWVQIIKYTSGTLDHCLKYMNENKPGSKYQFYELKPIPDLKNNQCDDYMCTLVRIDQKPEKASRTRVKPTGTK